MHPWKPGAPELILILLIVIWDIAWKGVALWKSARNNQITWFVFLLVINSAGILPLAYLMFFQKEKIVEVPEKSTPEVNQ